MKVSHKSQRAGEPPCFTSLCPNTKHRILRYSIVTVVVAATGKGGGGTHKLCWLNREGRLDNEMCCDQRYYGLSTGHMCIDGTERIDMFAMHR